MKASMRTLIVEQAPGSMIAIRTTLFITPIRKIESWAIHPVQVTYSVVHFFRNECASVKGKRSLRQPRSRS